MSSRIWFVVLIVMAGCATPSYTSKSTGLRIDMTKEEVTSTMGPPRRVAARKAANGLVETYSWWAPKTIGFTTFDNEVLSSDRVFVRFLNGRVTEWGDKYDMSDSMDKALDRSREMQSEVLKGLQRGQ